MPRPPIRKTLRQFQSDFASPSELRKGAKSAVPLVDRAIGNLQQWLIGTYHGVSKNELQVHLDELVFHHIVADARGGIPDLGRPRNGSQLNRIEQIRGAKDLIHNMLVVAEATR
jgi:hypothetical protein